MNDQQTPLLLIGLLMPVGFALLATGLCRSKNAAHTSFMTFFGSVIAVTALWICGYAVITDGHFLLRDPLRYGQFLSFMLPAIVATCIPIGALAERWRLKNFYLYAFVMGGLLWPVFARWTWGGGWLNGFVDAAGAGVVHALGGLCALAGALVLGPRYGRYNKKGQPAPMPAHNVPLALLGSFLLTVGWFGFNAIRAVTPLDVVLMTTALAGAGGALAAAVYMTWRTSKPDPTLVANGLLAGLVASSASVGLIGPVAGFVTGLVAGTLACLSVGRFDRLLVDDPVGAISVHGVAGLWGVIAVGLFRGGDARLGQQLLGCVALGVWAFGVAWVLFKLLDRITPMRPPPENEVDGLDIGELGVVGYPDIQSGS